MRSASRTRATIDWAVTRLPELGELWLLPVAAETWDGYLNDINGGHVTEQVVRSALDGARPGRSRRARSAAAPGMNCYAFKGGNGHRVARVIERRAARYTVGVFLQCNFGSRHELTIAGVPAGARAGRRRPAGRVGARGRPAPGR